MEFVATLLVLGFVFYVFMRWGCGGRMVHGLAPQEGDTEVRRLQLQESDPVCGMRVGSDDAFLLEHGTRIIRFCSEDCRERFKRHPESYL